MIVLQPTLTSALLIVKLLFLPCYGSVPNKEPMLWLALVDSENTRDHAGMSSDNTCASTYLGPRI